MASVIDTCERVVEAESCAVESSTGESSSGKVTEEAESSSNESWPNFGTFMDELKDPVNPPSKKRKLSAGCMTCMKRNVIKQGKGIYETKSLINISADPMEWWQQQMANRFLPSPPSIVEGERVFNIHTHQNRLSPQNGRKSNISSL